MPRVRAKVDIDRLRNVLDSNKRYVEATLPAAEAELAELDKRRAELIDLIGRARAVLGQRKLFEDERRTTLHDAMKLILAERPDRQMAVRDLVAELNRRGAYKKLDGSPVSASEVHARAKNYSRLFEKERGAIRLRDAEARRR